MFTEAEFTSRLEDLNPTLVITADISVNGGKIVNT
jgi:hypothetical protein